jgi:hypothetical protein
MLRRNMVTFEICQNLADAGGNGTPDRQFSEARLGAFCISSATGMLRRRQMPQQSTQSRPVSPNAFFIAKK